LLDKGLLRAGERWREKGVSGERFFSLSVSVRDALERVRDPEKKRLLIFLGGRRAVSLLQIREWGFSQKTLNELLKMGLVSEAKPEHPGTSPLTQEVLKDVGEKSSYIEGRFEEVLKFAYYRARRALGEKKSALFLFTGTSQLLKALEFCTEEVLSLHSSLGAGEFKRVWFQTAEGHKILFTTPVGVLAPLRDTGIIAVVDEASSLVRLRYAQDIDLRRLALILARKLSAEFVLCGPRPSINAYHYLGANLGKVREVASFRPVIRVLRRSAGEILTGELHEIISRSREVPTLFLVPKQGYSYMYCPRCQGIAQCPRCDKYLTYSKNSEKIFCTGCGYTHPDVYCPECEGKLEDTGFGIEKAIEVIENAFGVGDSMSFDTYPRWEEAHERVVVLTADPILSLPTYRASEEMFQYLMRSFRVAKRELILQTMFPGLHPVRGLLEPEHFYKIEWEERKRERLPPLWRLALVKTTKEDLDLYLKKVVSEHISSLTRWSKGYKEILIRFRDRRALKKLEEVRRRFSKFIIEVKVDPPL
jgi:primosomal protein N' (replication factor Y)